MEDSILESKWTGRELGVNAGTVKHSIFLLHDEGPEVLCPHRRRWMEKKLDRWWKRRKWSNNVRDRMGKSVEGCKTAAQNCSERPRSSVMRRGNDLSFVSVRARGGVLCAVYVYVYMYV